ncbi:hypothetical protein HJC99_00445 [Candidatus Saccharibacteria bacterium]|nr:hypothetical protein [Candidatus Saccharibacteria bacterium]
MEPTLTGTVPQPVTPYQSNPFALIWDGFRSLGANVGPLILLFLISIAVVIAFIPGIAVIALGHSQMTNILIGSALIFAALVVAVVIGVRIFAVGVLLYMSNAQGKKVEFGELYAMGKPFALRLAGLSLLMGFIFFGGFLLFIIPGILFIYWFTMAPYVLVDQNCSITEALGRSKAMVKGHGWEVYGFLATYSLISALENIPVIGSLISLVLGYAYGSANALRYFQLRDHAEANKPTGPVSGWNYGVIIGVSVLIVAFIAFFIYTISQPNSNSTY